MIPDAVDAGPLPGDRTLEREDAAEVREAFGRLSWADQELLELRVVAELSTDEVASVLGRRPGPSGWPRVGHSPACERCLVKIGEEDGGRASA